MRPPNRTGQARGVTDQQDGFAGDDAFRRSVSDRLSTHAAARGRTKNELRREFVLQRFLARVFAEPDSGWILKGGTAMLARLPDARHSRDVDLYRPGSGIDLNGALADLSAALNLQRPDRFRFVVEATRPLDDHAADLRVAAYIGATVLDRFTVDLTLHLRPIAGIEHVSPAHVLDLPGLPPMPELRLYPVHDQLADKICAMYARYGEHRAPSSRYRDLVDIVLILRQIPLDALQLRRALDGELKRRRMTVPIDITLPGPNWTAGYRAVVTSSPLPPDLHTATNAINHLAAFLQPIVDGAIKHGSWDPTSRRWRREP
jgi:predicted nucleotidyltransferase component of viral defense system